MLTYRMHNGQLKALLLVAVFACAIPHLRTAKSRIAIEEYATENAASPPYIKVVSEQRHKPFLALKDPEHAAAADVVQLYQQGANVSAAAYLLFGAAEPLSQVEGSSAALLPYLSPTILRLYASQPERCASKLVQRLYDLSFDLYGTEALKACHYTLYKALQATFSWVRDNIALRLQEVEGQPFATAAWPDLDLYPDPEFAAVVYDALTNEDKLGTTGDALWRRCGLELGTFAALVPRISTSLAALHADLAMLQTIGDEAHSNRWANDDGDTVAGEGEEAAGGAEAELDSADWGPEMAWPDGSSSGISRASRERVKARRAATEAESSGVALAADGLSGWLGGGLQGGHDVTADNQDRGQEGEDEEGEAFAGDKGLPDDEGAMAGSSIGLAGLRRRWRRRRLAAVPDNFVYDLPPGGFRAAPPAELPSLYIPLVFHILLYKDRTGSTAPTNYLAAGSYAQRLVTVANYMSAPTNIKFFVKEIRSNATVYPYLLVGDRMAWLLCPAVGSSKPTCLSNVTFITSTVVDFPRSINVYVVSDSTAGLSVPLGYAWVPGSDVYAAQGYVFLSWDSLSIFGSNSASLYNDGPNTLVHELFHHLGLRHTFAAKGSNASCTADDYVLDTPTTLGYASQASFATTSTSYCMELFWGQYGGDWAATYDRWSTTLGIPDSDKNAWADTCPTRAGYDELGNYMTYNTPVCFAALGHFTHGQAQLAHYTASELNPVLYAWGQYYAQSSPPPPNDSPFTDIYNNSCKVTRDGCQCKSSWSVNGVAYSFCDWAASDNILSCEVEFPSSCARCGTTGQMAQCILSCAATARTCKRPPYPGTRMPPPPPPRSPSPPPTPPPPPPLSVPDPCKVTASGCACRSTWVYDNDFYSYCSSPDGRSVLFCQVDPLCPSFDIDNPFDNCDASLTTSICGGDRIRMSASILTPDIPYGPPNPPSSSSSPPRPLLPPSPGSGAIAQMTGTIAVRRNCSTAGSDTRELESELAAGLASAVLLPAGSVTLTGRGCNVSSTPQAFTWNLTYFFPIGWTAEQIANTALLLSNTTRMKNAIFEQYQWKGEVLQTSYTGAVVLQWQPVISAGPTFIQRLSQYDSGLVEMLLPGGGVGLVCSSGSFTADEAGVICQQLGFRSGVPLATLPPSNASYQNSIYLYGLGCDGNASYLEDCESPGFWVTANSRCNLTTTAGVNCSGNVAAVVDASLTLNVTDCSIATGVGSSLFLVELFGALSFYLYNPDLYATSYPTRLDWQVPFRRLALRDRLACGRANGTLRLRVAYSVLLPYSNSTNAIVVDEVEANSSNVELIRSTLKSYIQERWGQLLSVGTSRVHVVDSELLCRSKDDKKARVCSQVSSSSPTGLDRKVPNTVVTYRQLIIICASILGFLLLIAVLLAYILFRRHRDASRVTPMLRNSAWTEGGEGAEGRGGSNSGGAGSGGGPPPTAAAPAAAAAATAQGSDAGPRTPIVPVAAVASSLPPPPPPPGMPEGEPSDTDDRLAMAPAAPLGRYGNVRQAPEEIVPPPPSPPGLAVVLDEGPSRRRLPQEPQQQQQQQQQQQDTIETVRLIGEVNTDGDTAAVAAAASAQASFGGGGGDGSGRGSVRDGGVNDGGGSGGGRGSSGNDKGHAGGSVSAHLPVAAASSARAVAALSSPREQPTDDAVSLPEADAVKPLRLPPLPSRPIAVSAADPVDIAAVGAAAAVGSAAPSRHSSQAKASSS